MKEIELIISDILSNLALATSLLYIWHKLLGKKIDLKNTKLYISIIILIVVGIFNYYMIDKNIKIIVITIIFMFIFRFIFKENLNKCIMTSIFYQMVVMISETIYALFIIIIFKSDAQMLLETFLGTLFTNIAIVLVSIVIIQFKFTKKIYNLIITFTEKIKNIQLLTLCTILIIALNLFPITIYYKVDFKFLLVFYSSMIITCFIIVIYTFKTQSNYNKVSDKYDVAIKSLNDYEDMMTKYRIANHENKNLLKAIRVMILNGEKDIPAYIDSIVEEKYNDDEKLLFKMNVIPSGGLRATIYSELLKIKENKLKYNLQIDRNLRTVDLIELDTNTIVDICKVIGVLIDNAIEEVKKLKSKNRNISISLFLDNNKLNIKVSNNYRGNIEVDKIYDEGYTTKGDGHGYGLALVKKIVNSNSMFENMTEITKDLFSQILMIKYKN